MKKIIALILSLCCLTGCAQQKAAVENKVQKNYVYGMWVSYYELENMADNGFFEGFEDLCKNAAELGVNTLYVHIKAMDTLFYNSNYLTTAEWCNSLNTDATRFMIETAHKYSLEFHAWINPYRLSHSKDAALSEHFDTFAENVDYARLDNGVYLNPASPLAQSLILNITREIVHNYNVDGIHLDDYFYPTTASSFDSITYEDYKKNSENPLSLEDYRRTNVNVMLLGIKQIISSSGKDITFSISPAADINKNYSELYADVSFWCNAGIIDVIIPQIYFGFNYPVEKYCFENLVLDWIKCVSDSNVSLYIGLAPYKLGTANEPDKAEWEMGVNVVADQLKNIFARGEINGIALFSYSSISNNGEHFVQQRNNIKQEIINHNEGSLNENK